MDDALLIATHVLGLAVGFRCGWMVRGTVEQRRAWRPSTACDHWPDEICRYCPPSSANPGADT